MVHRIITDSHSVKSDSVSLNQGEDSHSFDNGVQNTADTSLLANSNRDRKFSHLHLHTSYSLLDGAIRIPDLMQHVKSLGMDSVAMTDHGNMFGGVEFYKEAVGAGVKPIIGCEFYVAPNGRKEKKNIERLADGNNYHLILLAKDRVGYANIIRLASRSYSEGFYRKPRIDYDLLAECSQGLVCLTACLGGEVQQKIIKERFSEANQLAGKLKEIFGKDRFYLEIQNHGLPEEEIAARGNLEIARKNDIELCLTNDSHFLTKNDHLAQDILLRINQKKLITDPLPFSFNPEFYVKSPDEMFNLFPELPEAFHNTNRIAEMIDLNFEFGNPLLPRFTVPENETLDSYMHKLALTGLEKRYKEITPKIKERFDYEYETIKQMDFSGYFLIVQDFIHFAKKRGIPTGPGRGSAAGSIISYALGITDIDPLRYGLLFERFLNPDRREMPDIDVDFCTERREEVIQYVREKYGASRVGQIITYGTMAARACLKDVARVLDIPFGEANSISRMFPDTLNISIDGALQSSRELREYASKGDVQKKLFQVARTLEGNVRHTGVHAAGVVIAPAPLEELLPMATVSSRSGSKERVLVSQYDMQSLADVGLVKMDFLGLRNLSVIHETMELVKSRTGKAPCIDNKNPNDQSTYKLIQSARLTGIFQLESSPGMRELVMRMKPESFEDLIALIALFRPGPLQSGMADTYINRKKGKEKLTYAHPSLIPVLGKTYGVILYQEQVMQIAQLIGGLSPSEADSLRKAMGKKIPEKMEEMRKKFVEGALSKGYHKKFSSELYEQMSQFASYGFNKSHSAAYACIVYQTAYLKANHPTEYMCALLNSGIDKTERLVPYINACASLGIRILGPDINESQMKFSVENEKAIRFGLAGVKNIGSLAVESLLTSRKSQVDGRFHSFFHFMENMDLRLCNRRMVEVINQSGAFLNLGYKRKSIQESVEMGFAHAQRVQSDRQTGQSSLFDNVAMPNEQTEPIPRGDSVKEFPHTDVLTMEREVLGFYLSGHPLSAHERKLRKAGLSSIGGLASWEGGKRIEVAVVIADFSTRLTRSGGEMCRLVLEDSTGSCEAVIFPAVFKKDNIKKRIVKSALVVVNAILEKKEDTGTPNLLIHDIFPLNTETITERQEKSLHIQVQNRGVVDYRQVIKQLRLVLSGSKGPLSVYFHLLDESDSGIVTQVIRAHESFRVDYSHELCKRLSGIDEVRAIDLSIGDQIKNQYKASLQSESGLAS